MPTTVDRGPTILQQRSGETTQEAATMPLVIWFERLGRGDVALVGGKNASLGEMVRSLGENGVKVPPGFATTAEAYWQYVEENGLGRVVADSLKAFNAGHAPLAEIGATIRQEFLRGTWPKDL